jgi:hypothetical protein
MILNDILFYTPAANPARACCKQVATRDNLDEPSAVPKPPLPQPYTCPATVVQVASLFHFLTEFSSLNGIHPRDSITMPNGSTNSCWFESPITDYMVHHVLHIYLALDDQSADISISMTIKTNKDMAAFRDCLFLRNNLELRNAD